MPQPNRFWRWLVPALFVYIVGFAVAAVWDYSITAALYTPNSIFAILMEAFGWYPAFIPAVLLFALPATQSPLHSIPAARRVLFAIPFLGGVAALYAVSYRYLAKRGLVAGASDPVSYLWLFAGVLAAGLLCFALWRLRGAVRRRLQFFAAWGSIYLAANLVVVNLFKLLWARTRFDDMTALGAPHLFTPWHQLFGGGGSSFPSGHTANAAGIFALLILCDLFPSFAPRRRLVYVVCWGYTALMAFSRLVIGRHFLSDTLAASAIVVLLFFLLRRTPAYRQSLQRCLAAADTLAEKETENTDAV